MKHDHRCPNCTELTPCETADECSLDFEALCISCSRDTASWNKYYSNPEASIADDHDNFSDDYPEPIEY